MLEITTLILQDQYFITELKRLLIIEIPTIIFNMISAPYFTDTYVYIIDQLRNLRWGQ